MKKRLGEIFRPESKYQAFLLSVITFGLAYGIYKGVIDNYLAALYTFSAERIYKVGAVFMLIGMGAQAVVPASRVLVILCIFVYSLGDHMQLGMRNSAYAATIRTDKNKGRKAAAS